MYLKKLLIFLTFLIYFASALPYFYKFTFYEHESFVPLLSSENAKIVPDQYIIIFKKFLDQDKIDSHYNQLRQLIVQNNDEIFNNINEIRHTYDFNEFKGYVGRFSENVLNKIRQSSEVDYVEKDQIVQINFEKKNKIKNYRIQYNPPWGLARISARIDDWPSDSGRYWYHESGGDGVAVYIIDTGVNIYHDEFEGRAIWGVDFSNEGYDGDGHGHGTHVAGIVAGKTYGVAKKATIIAVKVLNSYGYGYISDIIKGIEWTVIQHKTKRMDGDYKGSVINMSLGGDKSIATNEAANAAVKEGVVVAVAAGNDHNDACNESPASAELAITVGASDINDYCARFSNNGKCVDIFAPGVDILSSWIGPENNVVATLSGTSMSSPHISGLCALFISMGIANNPKDVKNKIIEHSTRDALKKIPINTHTPNRLAYNSWWWRDIFDFKLSTFKE
ncbi:serine protease [Gigaspora margarita]|uniref:Serine protease n=1 Tax=Gigaspora margarita TaxID=4874 RepID=A0A8H4B359_GIGMA|nr:serine protease [Gigaspora margarita]